MFPGRHSRDLHVWSASLVILLRTPGTILTVDQIRSLGVCAPARLPESPREQNDKEPS